MPVRIAGHDTQVHLDTGSAFGLTLPVKFLTELPLASQPKQAGRVHTAGGEFSVSIARLNGTIELGKYKGCATWKWRSSGAACLPVVLKAVVELTTSEGDDSVSASDGPEHAGLFEARTDYGFAPGFDNAGADKEMLAAELWVAHAGCILLKVVGLDTESSR